MAIDIGDAILRFLADTTNLDGALDKVGPETEAKLAPAEVAVQELGNTWTATGEKAVVSAEIQSNAAASIPEKVAPAATAVEGMGSKFAGVGAAIEGVGTVVAGVGVAITAAFSGLIIIALLDALSKGVESLKEWATGVNKIEEAWQKYDTTVFTTSTHIQAEIDKQQQKIIQLTEGPIAALDFELQHLETTAFKTFDAISKGIDQAVKAMEMEQNIGGFGITNVFGPAAKDLNKFRDQVREAMQDIARANPGNPLAPYQKAIELVSQKEKELTGLISQRTAASGKDASAAVDGLHAERKAINDMYADLKLGMEDDKKRTEVVSAEKHHKVVEEAQKAAKEQIKLDQDVAKSRLALDKELEKSADDVSRRLTAELTAQLKEEQKHNAEVLHGYIEEEKAAEKSIEGQIAIRKEQTQTDAEHIKAQYDMGLIKANDYLAQLKKLYNDEVAALKAMLDKKGALVVQELQNEAALQGKIITAEQAKELASYKAIENQKLKIQQDADAKMVKAQDQTEKNLEKSWKKLGPVLAQFQKELKQTGSVGASVGAALGEAISLTAQAYAQGAVTIGQALEQMLQAELQALAKKAEVKGTEQLAEAFGSWPDGAAMAHHFAASALWFSLGAGLSVGAAELGGGSSGGGGNSGSGSNPRTTSAAGQSSANPTQTANVPRLAAGGLATHATQVVVGDSRGGGDAREAIIPLDDHRAVDQIADALAARMGGSGSGITMHVGGVISADNLNKVVKKINRQVGRRQTRLTSGNSFRVTRRG